MYLEGKKTEALFAQSFRLIRWATTEEDMKLHFDGVFDINGQEVRVDIKGHRARNRGEGPGEMCWVELRNVRGERGWLFGLADIIAFQYYEQWLLVRREELITYVISTLEYRLEKEPYCLYKRYGRNDLLVMIPYSEIKKLSIT